MTDRMRALLARQRQLVVRGHAAAHEAPLYVEREQRVEEEAAGTIRTVGDELGVEGTGEIHGARGCPDEAKRATETCGKVRERSDDMAEPTATSSKTVITERDEATAGSSALAKTKKPSAPSTPLQIALRVMIGFAGLALLVGFFLPWLNRQPQVADDAAIPGAMVAYTGLSLAMSGDLAGSPSMLLFLIPGLGIALSAIAFMGFKWSGQVAVGIAVALIGYALYVLLQMFVQHTGLGLWVVAGGTFVILLLGVIAWMTGRDRKPAPGTDVAPDPKP